MKTRKVIAFILAASVLAGMLVGCRQKTAPLTTEEFVKACDHTLGLEELDANEMYSANPDILEDGFYLTFDEDIEDVSAKVAIPLGLYFLQTLYIPDEIASVAVAGKFGGLNDTFQGPEEFRCDCAYAIQITLEDDIKADDYMERVKDLLDEYGVDASDLSQEEYYSSSKEGYLKLHLDLSDAVDCVLDDDEFENAINGSPAAGEVVDDLRAISGDAYVSLEINGANILIVAGININVDAKNFNEFVDAFGVENNPADLPANSDLARALVDTEREAVLFYEGARLTAAAILEEDEEVAEIVSQIKDMTGM